MTDLEYLDHAEAALTAVELACDRINDETDADVDNQRTGGMITLTFANRSQIVINLQKPLQEIWMAARAGGFHYKFNNGTNQDKGQWLDTKDGSEFFAGLSRYASEQSGMQLSFKP
jgi:CyaY protein